MLKYITSTFIYSTTIAGSGQHPFDTIHDVGLSTQFLVNGRPESQLVQCRFLNCVRRWLNTTPTLAEHMILLHQRVQESLDG